MAARKKRLIRATISVDKDDYAAIGALAERMEVSSSWLIRQALREFLDKYGDQGQPELALRLADKRRT
jgi:predicted transcriptional regulator